VLVGGVLFKVFIIALALSLDVFAVSVGVGVRPIPPHRKLRIGLTFASAEVTMICLGAALGAAAGHLIGDYAGYIGFAALVGVGLYMVKESRSEFSETSRLNLASGRGLILASLSVSLDSLGVGFSILYIGVPMPVSLIVIACVSLGATTLGLTIGRMLGRWSEQNAAFYGGILLALTGVLFAVLKALRIG
jgi:putative Mn2+ efflux pump MntP